MPEIQQAHEGFHQPPRADINEPRGRLDQRRAELSPNIWFRCGSRWVEKIVSSEVGNLSLARHYGLGDKIRVGLRAAVPAADSTFPVPHGLSFDGGFPLLDSHTLFVSVERPPHAADASACGLVCSVAIRRGRKAGVSWRLQNRGHPVDQGWQRGREPGWRHHGPRLAGLEFLTTCRPGGHEPGPGGIRRRLGQLLGDGGQRRRVATSATLLRGAVSIQKIEQAEWDPIRDIYSISWLGGGWERAGELRFPFAERQPESLGPRR